MSKPQTKTNVKPKGGPPATEEEEETKTLSVIHSDNATKLVGVDDVASKLNKSGWDRMEKNHNPFTMTVLQSLYTYGKEADKSSARMYFNQDKGLSPIGDGLYLEEVRPALSKVIKLSPCEAKPVVDKKKKKNNTKKKGLTKEEIIAQKTADDVKKYLPPLLANASKTPICRETRAEFRLIQFMLYADFVCKHLVKDPNSYLAYEGLIAMHNALSSAQGVQGISLQVIVDAHEVLGKLRDQARFLYEELLTVYPRLVFNNLYSDLYHESIIEPYNDQKRIIDAFDHPNFLAFYNTVPGSGKTTAVMGIVARAMCEAAVVSDEIKAKAERRQKAKEESLKAEKAELNKGRKYKLRKRLQVKKSQKGSGNRVVIFVCTNMLVREQVGRDAFNLDVPFAVAANFIYREHFNAKVRDVALVISDLESALDQLNKLEHRDPILFIDEPTIAAETDHNINNKIMEIMSYVPRQTILSSATMPRIEELPTMVKTFRWIYTGCDVCHITSRRIAIGCHAVHKGITVFPFQNAKDKESLAKCVNNLNLNPFLFRFLSIEVVVTLRERMSRFKLKFPTFAEIFPNPANITHQKIADHAMDLLDILLESGNSKVITECCSPLTAQKYRPFELRNLLTEDAHQYMQGTLYAALDPLEKALELSKLFLDEMPSIKELLKEFNKAKEIYEKEKAQIERNVKNEDKKSQMMQGLREPSLNIPIRFVPNTLEHFKKYAPPGTKYDPRSLQTPPIATDIPEDLDVPDHVVMLLYLGIGVYSPASKILNPEKKDGVDTRYTEKVVEMCSSGYISFLFADRSIVYGTNFPFSNVFIDPSFAEESSLNTLYQLIGRAGRVGRSYMAKVFLIDEKITDRIVSFSEENIEATNLEKAMERVVEAREIDFSQPCTQKMGVPGQTKKMVKEQEKKEKADRIEAQRQAYKNSGKTDEAAKESEEEEEEDWEKDLDDEKEAAPADGADDDEDVDDWENL